MKLSIIEFKQLAPSIRRDIILRRSILKSNDLPYVKTIINKYYNELFEDTNLVEILLSGSKISNVHQLKFLLSMDINSIGKLLDYVHHNVHKLPYDIESTKWIYFLSCYTRFHPTDSMYHILYSQMNKYSVRDIDFRHILEKTKYIKVHINSLTDGGAGFRKLCKIFKAIFFCYKNYLYFCQCHLTGEQFNKIKSKL